MKPIFLTITLLIAMIFVGGGSCPDSSGEFHDSIEVIFHNVSSQDVHMYRGSALVTSDETRVNVGSTRTELSTFHFGKDALADREFPFSVARPGVILDTRNFTATYTGLRILRELHVYWDGEALSFETEPF